MIRKEFRVTRYSPEMAIADLGSLPFTRWHSALFALFLLVTIVGGDMSIAHGASFVERAQEYLEEGDLQSATIELKNALQRDPNNAEGRFLLGKVLLREGNPLSAEKELLRARELGYVSNELDLMLAYARLNLRRFDDVLGDVSEELTIESDVQRDLFVARGEALLGLGKFEEAESIFDRVLREGAHARALTNKARIAMILVGPERARELLDQALATDPDDPLLAAVDAEWFFRARQFEEANARFSRAIQLDPTRLASHLGKVQTELVLGNYAEAEDLIETLQAAEPGNLLIILQDSIVQFLKGNYSAAKRQAERVLSRANNQPNALFVAGHSAFRLQQYDQARVRLMPYLAQNPEDSGSRAVLGAAMLKLGNPADAYSIVSAPDAPLPDNEDYVKLLAVTAIGAGDQEAGLRYLERLALKKPNDADTQERVGNARAALGDYAGSAAALERAIELDQSRLGNYAQLFAVYSSQGQLAEALNIAQATKERFPGKAAGDTYLGIVYLMQQERDQAQQAFQSALNKEPDNAEAALNLVNIYVLENKIAEARDTLDRLLAANPDHPTALIAAADLERRSGNNEKAEAFVKEALAQEPGNPRAKEILASVYLTSNRPADAVALTRQVLVEHPDNVALLQVAGLARLRAGDNAGALSVFDHLAELRPNSIGTLEYLSAALEWNSRVPEALAVTERILRLDAQNTVARFGRARYLAHLGRLDEAKSAVQSLQEEFPDHPDLLIVEARIALVEGRAKDAKAAADKAFEMAPTNKVLIERARMTFAAGEREEGLSLLRAWLADHPDDLLIHTTLAETLLGAGEFQEAKLQYEKILALSPEQPRHLNNLAWVYINLGESERAVPIARKAVELAPQSASIVDTLALALLESGQKREALTLLSDAHAAARNNATIWFRFAWALAENEQPARARVELEKLLDSVKVFPERQQAERLLESLREG